jgi:predicted nucleic acid-binding protein
VLVVDASALTDLLLDRSNAPRIASALAEHHHDLHAPELLDVEVVSALRRSVAGGHATPARAEAAIVDLSQLAIERYGHTVLVPRIWQLRDAFSAYDAAYVALAEALGETCGLLTADRRLARGIAGSLSVQVVDAS